MKINLYYKLRKTLYSSPHMMTATLVTCCVAAVLIPCSFLGFNEIGVTAALGVVAAAVSQSDEHPLGRIQSTIIMLLAFATTTISVALLKSHFDLFVIGFALSTITFIVIGGISPQLKAISYGTILISIYAALSWQPNQIWWIIPLTLCAGASIYSISAILFLLKHPFRPLEEQLAEGFLALENFLEAKAESYRISCTEQSQLATYSTDEVENSIAETNSSIVDAMERCKETLNSYGHWIGQKRLANYLERFMLLENLHERAASSHERISSLVKRQRYNDIMEGIAELLHQLGTASHAVAEELLTEQKYTHPVALAWVIEALTSRISAMPIKSQRSLDMLLHNLSRSHQSLQKLESPTCILVTPYTQIPQLQQDDRFIYQKIRVQLNFKHSRMRYAIRLSVCFVLGTIISHYAKIPHGEWIALTALFVSQNTFLETQRRLWQRVIGTLSGVILGIMLLNLLPTINGQILVICGTAFAFFYFLKKRYAFAVVFITIYVLDASELVANEGMIVPWPRILATLIGAFLSYITVRILWPDWQYKRLPTLIKEAQDIDATYFKEIIHQWKADVEDTLEYRIIRRNAHLADNSLTQARRSIQIEPTHKAFQKDEMLRQIYLNHALLSHISALGAHREETWPDLPLLNQCVEQILRGIKEPASKDKYDDILYQLKEQIQSLTKDQHANNTHRITYRLFYNIVYCLRDFESSQQKI